MFNGKYIGTATPTGKIIIDNIYKNIQLIVQTF